MFICHMVNIYFSAEQNMRHFCQCSLLTRRHFKDDFSHKLTSSRFTHVCYEKGKNVPFLLQILSQPFLLPAPSVVYLNRTLIVPSSIPCSCNFSFFQ